MLPAAAGTGGWVPSTRRCPGRAGPGRAHGTLAEILLGPAHDASGAVNLNAPCGRPWALRGYEMQKDMQKAELVVMTG